MPGETLISCHLDKGKTMMKGTGKGKGEGKGAPKKGLSDESSEFIHQSPQTLENLEVPESEFAPSEEAEDTSQLDRLPPEWIEWLDEKSVWSLFVCGRTTALSAAFLAYTGRMYLQH